MTAPPVAGVVLLAESAAMTPTPGSIPELVDVVAAAVEGGIRTVIVRDKNRPAHERSAIVAAVGKLGATVLLARDERGDPLGADGIHLATRRATCLTPNVPGEGWLGVSAHDEAEIERAVAAGADYVTVSPVYETESKPGYGPALGIDGLAALVTKSPVPVVALGGVTTPERVMACRSAGAVGVAVMGAILRADDPTAAAAALTTPTSENSARKGSRSDLYQPEFSSERTI